MGSYDSVNHWDNVNVASLIAGEDLTNNALMIEGTGYSSATITLNSSTPNTQWFDMLMYPSLSVEVLTNTTPATLTFQTSGDASQTNTTSMYMGQVANDPTITTTSATATFYGTRKGRYFRISSNNGAGTTTLVITFFTTPIVFDRFFASQTGTWNTSVSATPTVTTVSVGTSSTSVLASNATRKGLILSNAGANNIFVNLAGGTAVNTNTLLLPTSAALIITRYVPTTAITAIAATGATNLSVTELA